MQYAEQASETRSVTSLDRAKGLVEAGCKRAEGLLMSAHYGGCYPTELRSQAAVVKALCSSMRMAAAHAPTAMQVASSRLPSSWDCMLRPERAAHVAGRAIGISGRQSMSTALEILDEALDMGKRAALPDDVVIARLEAAKRMASLSRKSLNP
jgi:hypothetical protein